MVKENMFIVKPEDERPARRDGTCFYCHQPIGSRHKEDCVIPRKTCVVDFTIRLVTSEPAHWPKEMIEGHYNLGSWCCDNLLRMIEQYQEQTGRCLCNLTTASFVREATKEDEEWFGYDPAECDLNN